MVSGIFEKFCYFAREIVSFFCILGVGLFSSSALFCNTDLKALVFLAATAIAFFADIAFKRMRRRSGVTLVIALAGLGAFFLDVLHRSMAEALFHLLWIESKASLQLNQPYAICFLILIFVLGAVARIGVRIRPT